MEEITEPAKVHKWERTEFQGLPGEITKCNKITVAGKSREWQKRQKGRVHLCYRTHEGMHLRFLQSAPIHAILLHFRRLRNLIPPMHFPNLRDFPLACHFLPLGIPLQVCNYVALGVLLADGILLQTCNFPVALACHFPAKLHWF